MDAPLLSLRGCPLCVLTLGYSKRSSTRHRFLLHALPSTTIEATGSRNPPRQDTSPVTVDNPPLPLPNRAKTCQGASRKIQKSGGGPSLSFWKMAPDGPWPVPWGRVSPVGDGDGVSSIHALGRHSTPRGCLSSMPLTAPTSTLMDRGDKRNFPSPPPVPDSLPRWTTYPSSRYVIPRSWARVRLAKFT